MPFYDFHRNPEICLSVSRINYQIPKISDAKTLMRKQRNLNGEK